MHKKKEIQDFQPINIDWITTGNAWKVNKNIKLGAVLGSLEMTNYIFFFEDGLTLRILCEWYKNCQLMSNYKIIPVFNKMTVSDVLIRKL